MFTIQHTHTHGPGPDLLAFSHLRSQNEFDVKNPNFTLYSMRQRVFVIVARFSGLEAQHVSIN